MAIALGYGKVEVATTTVYYARYLDRVVTTPLLLLALALRAGVAA
ncbi:MAG: bacteriorhodopsin [Deinococcota bacterium]|jgi:bacteriorhodopsin|nr:bacteriorhodopsin [Deinococcota bacterium]